MAIPFDDDLSLLAADLERAGYGQPRVLRFPYTPARRIEIHLPDGLIVNWDRIECVLFVEGPRAQREHVEKFLELREENGLRRVWAMCPHNVKAIAMAALLLAVGATATASFLSHRSHSTDGAATAVSASVRTASTPH